MKIHELPGDPGIRQKTKRRGRGESSGLGRTSGHGNKGRQARSGKGDIGSFEGGQMPLIRRLPKRGFFNPFRKEFRGVNLANLEKNFEAGATVDREALLRARLIKASEVNIKILGDGKLTKKLTVKANAFSATAKDKIAAAGGTAEVI